MKITPKWPRFKIRDYGQIYIATTRFQGKTVSALCTMGRDMAAKRLKEKIVQFMQEELNRG